MPPPSACPWAGAGLGHDDSKTIFAMLLRLLQDTSIIDDLGIMASLPGEAVEHWVRQVGRGREGHSHDHFRSDPFCSSRPWEPLHNTPELTVSILCVCAGCGCGWGHLSTCWRGALNS